MRRLSQLVLVALVAPGTVLLGPVTAATAAGTTAATTSGTVHAHPAVLQSAWFWQSAYEQVNPPVAPPAAPPTEPSGVPHGDLAVANTASDGTSSKMTVLAFSLGAVTPGATITSFTVTLSVDSGNGAVSSPGAAPVVACLPTRAWAPGEGVDYTNAPPVDCSDKVEPAIDGDTYTFAIPAIAQRWVDGDNLGVGIVSAPDNTQPFQVVFAGGKAVKAAMTYTPAVSTGTSAPGHTGAAAPAAAAGTGTRTGGGGPTGSSAPAATDVPLPPAAPTTTTPLEPAQEPQVADGAAPPVATAPVARSRRAPSGPNAAFWLGAIGLALLMLTAATILRDNRVPVAAAGTSRLSRVLRDRERGPLGDQRATTLTVRRA